MVIQPTWPVDVGHGLGVRRQELPENWPTTGAKSGQASGSQSALQKGSRGGAGKSGSNSKDTRHGRPVLRRRFPPQLQKLVKHYPASDWHLKEGADSGRRRAIQMVPVTPVAAHCEAHGEPCDIITFKAFIC